MNKTVIFLAYGFETYREILHAQTKQYHMSQAPTAKFTEIEQPAVNQLYYFGL